MRIRLARTRFWLYAAAVILAAAGSFVKTPYSLLLPGTALDLRDVVAVPGHPEPAVHLYMTDVSLVVGATPFALLAALAPGARVVRTTEVIPTSVDDERYEALMREEMRGSQDVATYVAERAAGLPVGRAIAQLVVGGLSPRSRAPLRPGDLLLAVDGTPVASPAALQDALARLRPGETARIVYSRDGKRAAASVPTIALGGKTRLGLYLGVVRRIPPAPVPVRYAISNVSGSSGGLMFALEIYRTLRPASAHAGERVAGTGTLDSDGRVGAIAGTAQKLVAAERAGATVFLVPEANFAEIAHARGVRVVPVRTFDEAVRALAS